MKNLRIYIAAAILCLTVIPFTLNASPKKSDPVSVTESVKAEKLLNRLEEIDGMDKSDLSRTEKRQLNKEVRSIKKELKEMGGGIYLSVAAIIIIILLLILLI